MFKVKLINMSFWPLFLAFVIIGSIIIFLLIEGGLLLSTLLYPILNAVSVIAVLVSTFIFLPFSRIKSKKDLAVTGLLATSYILGATLWTFSFITAYEIWGFLGLAIGLFLFGVGVIPVAIIASIFALEWMILLKLLLLIAFIHTLRSYVASLKTQSQTKRRKERPFIQEDAEEGEYEEVD